LQCKREGVEEEQIREFDVKDFRRNEAEIPEIRLRSVDGWREELTRCCPIPMAGRRDVKFRDKRVAAALLLRGAGLL
jgi:hypothetical protein